MESVRRTPGNRTSFLSPSGRPCPGPGRQTVHRQPGRALPRGRARPGLPPRHRSSRRTAAGIPPAKPARCILGLAQAAAALELRSLWRKPFWSTADGYLVLDMEDRAATRPGVAAPGSNPQVAAVIGPASSPSTRPPSSPSSSMAAFSSAARLRSSAFILAPASADLQRPARRDQPAVGRRVDATRKGGGGLTGYPQSVALQQVGGLGTRRRRRPASARQLVSSSPALQGRSRSTNTAGRSSSSSSVEGAGAAVRSDAWGSRRPAALQPLLPRAILEARRYRRASPPPSGGSASSAPRAITDQPAAPDGTFA